MNKLLIVTASFFAACSYQDAFDAQQVIDDGIAAHGEFRGLQVSFTFRDRDYSVLRTRDGYTYTREWVDDSLGQVRETLKNSRDFKRYVNGELTDVPDSMKVKYSESINSVLYFFQLPYVLNDPAVIKEDKGKTVIKGEPYYAVQVTFLSEGGGKDYQDVFMFWFHEHNKTLDYLAYSYFTEGGGVRFREAIHRRNFKGLLIQDYVNYKAAKEEKLENLPALFENDRLENLSLIVNNNVKVKKAAP